MLTVTKFRLSHEDWTQLTGKYDVKVLKRSTYVDGSFILDTVRLEGRSCELTQFLAELKSHPRIEEVRIAELLSEKGLAMLRLKTRLEGSVTQLMVREAYEFRELVENGKETWIAVVPSTRVSKLRESIESVAEVEEVSATKFSYFKGNSARLTEREREVLATALRMGYFSSPRRANASQVAARLGMSKVSLTQHLRRISGKLAARELGALNPLDSGLVLYDPLVPPPPQRNRPCRRV
ncbi:bacterio-opsin activator [Sulfodiicoccus acidiphilus]|uniref:Bacterio-opsin activator n=1 Tax=Sulfodiicoccus acidiphilus TaxID=1670455 RepID=A0A348B641_9CREN|nr:helix-turn-helix domain-containing protein [Sulfodiicoccus acidiphilus]BBD73643.1 bacterio-opsin activator [Sulfodiicoccus acidiphilus]GGU02099.1 bacterio-opsin activator [Sulfodiicoccus acidiphilus]